MAPAVLTPHEAAIDLHATESCRSSTQTLRASSIVIRQLLSAILDYQSTCIVWPLQDALNSISAVSLWRRQRFLLVERRNAQVDNASSMLTQHRFDAL